MLTCQQSDDDDDEESQQGSSEDFSEEDEHVDFPEKDESAPWGSDIPTPIAQSSVLDLNIFSPNNRTQMILSPGLPHLRNLNLELPGRGILN